MIRAAIAFMGLTAIGLCMGDVGSVRIALDAYTNSVRRTAMRIGTIRNIGPANTDGAAYHCLCLAVSNHVDGVFGDISQITTNDAERLVLMSTAWQYDEDYYLRVYDILTVQALSNRVSVAELEWFGLPGRNDLVNCIRCRYREPHVADLARRISLVSGDTNFYQSVISGEAYTNYLHEVSAGLWQ